MDQVPDYEHVNTCLCDGIRYGVVLAEDRLQLRVGPDSPGQLCPEGLNKEYLFADILSVKIIVSEVEEPSSASSVLSRLDFFPFRNASPSPRQNTTNQSKIVLCIARRREPCKWRPHSLILTTENLAFGQQLCDSLKETIAGSSNRPKRLMFFVNPVSGGGCALKIFEKRVIPILRMVDTRFSYIVTTHAGHAKQWLLQEPWKAEGYDGLIAVGGDGIFNECLEGFIRSEQDEDVTVTSDLTPSATATLGIIPAGSTDSIGYCIGLGDACSALIHVLLGRSMKLDVGAVFQEASGCLLRFFCAFLGYGFFSDTLKTSEKRWLRRYFGKTRYTLAGAQTFFRNKSYDGHVTYKTGDANPCNSSSDLDPEYPDVGVFCAKDCTVCSVTDITSPEVPQSPNSPSSPDVFESTESPMLSSIEADTVELVGTSDTEVTTSSEDWNNISDKFSNVIAVSLCCGSAKSPRGLAPASHCGDGRLDVLLVRAIGRVKLLNYLVSISRGIGPKRVLGKNLRAYRVSELIFRTTKKPKENEGGGREASMAVASTVWNCDGEIITEADIHVKVYRQLITIFGSGREF
ncbi:hypothetical protein RvY_17477 [Ramazzottius varieornatus]|uniref:DAGKc domain-containing protein n=1 Tax=Ramazzottius varieornatus TaxID=947166 RepID=A0A1D1W290_RAMVA|nr:hypothetical protein RvY_17477 [Ramazzottius varieornatus]